MPILSIIVPIYNVEKYLAHCLDSILAQDFTDFEVILINDGSPDNCKEIMERYADKDRRIITVYQDNQGVSAARNVGIIISKGKYIGFVDPDDWISPYMYSAIIPLMEKTNAELGIVGVKREELIQNETALQPSYDKVEKLYQNRILKELFSIPLSIWEIVTNKVYRRECIHDLFDTKQKMGEDATFNVKYIESINFAIWIKQPLYHVYSREGSATRSDPKNFLESIAVKKELGERIKKKRPASDYRIVSKNYFDACVRAMVIQTKGSKERASVRRIVEKEHCKMLLNKEIRLRAKIGYTLILLKEYFSWLTI